MPLALLVIGIVFLIAAVRGTQGELFDTLKDDFTGPGNFLYWGIALFVIGAIGYYRPLKPLSNSFMLLVVIVLFLSNRGFFERFLEQIRASESAGSGSGLVQEANRLIGSVNDFARYVPGFGWSR